MRIWTGTDSSTGRPLYIYKTAANSPLDPLLGGRNENYVACTAADTDADGNIITYYDEEANLVFNKGFDWIPAACDNPQYSSAQACSNQGQWVDEWCLSLIHI